jgi:hypothetical protein
MSAFAARQRLRSGDVIPQELDTSQLDAATREAEASNERTKAPKRISKKRPEPNGKVATNKTPDSSSRVADVEPLQDHATAAAIDAIITQE